jgi:hypothetical protein
MKTISKALVGTVAAGAMALASATPAMARDRDHDGVSAGDIIAGALVIGGIAAVAGSIGNDRGYNGTYGGPYYGGNYNDRYGYNNYGYNRGGDPRSAVEQCVNAARSDLNRRGYRGAQVTDIRSVNPDRDGYKVRGTVVVNERGGGWNRDYNYRYGGQNYDRGNFSCDVSYGRVVDLDYGGLKDSSRYGNGNGYNNGYGSRYGW